MNWLYYCSTILWTGLEAYWVALSIEGQYPLHITLPMVTISALVALGFLHAWRSSK